MPRRCCHKGKRCRAMNTCCITSQPPKLEVEGDDTTAAYRSYLPTLAPENHPLLERIKVNISASHHLFAIQVEAYACSYFVPSVMVCKLPGPKTWKTSSMCPGAKVPRGQGEPLNSKNPQLEGKTYSRGFECRTSKIST